eukprot:3603479-Lingulodinium_polyedra.AAC.1
MCGVFAWSVARAAIDDFVPFSVRGAIGARGQPWISVCFAAANARLAAALSRGSCGQFGQRRRVGWRARGRGSLQKKRVPGGHCGKAGR